MGLVSDAMDRTDTRPSKQAPRGGGASASLFTIFMVMLVSLGAGWILHHTMSTRGHVPLVSGTEYGQEFRHPGLPSLNFDGVMRSGEDRFAVINGVVARTGSMVEGFLVEWVDLTHVELSRGDKHFTMRLM
ncbi:MAG: hypothetical protein CMJ18_26890 [Phycisphaeraceae bacterium]|nr:hypothetical protein [Phycisphaeraceae bacterium]